MQQNQQPIEKQLTSLHQIQVHSIWHTIQGEGPYAGQPAIFVRLAGCNLQCSFCDTDYTSKRTEYSDEDLVAEVLRISGEHFTQLIVITGGEPFRQSIAYLIEQLLLRGCQVQIETNGTLMPLGGIELILGGVTIVCCPKTAKVDPFFTEQRIYADIKWKYIIEAGRVCEYDGLPLASLGMNVRPARPPAATPRSHVFVQPLDVQDETKNKENMKQAVESCMRYGYRLCLQIHKIVGLD